MGAVFCLELQFATRTESTANGSFCSLSLENAYVRWRSRTKIRQSTRSTRRLCATSRAGSKGSRRSTDESCCCAQTVCSRPQAIVRRKHRLRKPPSLQSCGCASRQWSRTSGGHPHGAARSRIGSIVRLAKGEAQADQTVETGGVSEGLLVLLTPTTLLLFEI